MAAFKLDIILVADTSKIWLAIGFLDAIASFASFYRLY